MANGKGIRHDSTLWSWGENRKTGLVGNGGTTLVQSPMQIISQYADWTAISSGEMHQMALRSNGELYVWGVSWYGVLGIGDTLPDGTLVGNNDKDLNPLRFPTRLLHPNNLKWRSISAGCYHSFAIDETGALWGWGRNGYLGLAGNGQQNRPTKIDDGNWTAIVAGSTHSLGIKNGKLYVWGKNHFGQLGIGTLGGDSYFYAPIEITVPGVSNWSSVTARNLSSYAIDDNGNLWSWGSNEFGQLGRSDEGIQTSGKYPVSSTPARVQHYRSWKSVSVLAGTAHVLAIDDDDRLYAWGENYSGQIGNGSHGGGNVVNLPTPVIIPEYPYAKWSNASTAFGEEGYVGGVSMAVMLTNGINEYDDGSLWVWGDNKDGQLGLGPNSQSGIYARPQRMMYSGSR